MGKSPIELDLTALVSLVLNGVTRNDGVEVLGLERVIGMVGVCSQSGILLQALDGALANVGVELLGRDAALLTELFLRHALATDHLFHAHRRCIEGVLYEIGGEFLDKALGQFLADNGLKQARIAETEKYAHVTFFFNGGVEEPNEGEDRILVKSPKVATYDLKPEMSAYEVCDKLVGAIKSENYDVIVINFANPDMVGHTGVQEAAIKAVEAVDECVGKAVEALKEVDGQMFICADHGNAEQLIDEETGEPFTAHTTNPVPFILVNADPAYKLREGGCLADIAPTLIELMGMQQPAEMTGKSLLVK